MTDWPFSLRLLESTMNNITVESAMKPNLLTNGQIKQFTKQQPFDCFLQKMLITVKITSRE